jgi:hypothetical protein
MNIVLGAEAGLPGQMINDQGKWYTPTPGALEWARSHPNWIDPAAAAANDSGHGASGRAAAEASNAAAKAGRAQEAAQGAAMARASDYSAAYTQGFMTAGLMEPDDEPRAGLSPIMLVAAAAAAYFALK